MLKLVGEMRISECAACRGRGWVPCPPTYSVRTSVHYSGGEGYGPVNQVSTGKKIPCPDCKGKKATVHKEGGAS